MKKARIAILLLLGIIVLTLVSGCSAIFCAECGRYVSQSNPSDSLELMADGTFYAYYGDEGTGVTGTWKSNENRVLLIFDVSILGIPITTQATLEGDILTLPDGDKFVKQ